MPPPFKEQARQPAKTAWTNLNVLALRLVVEDVSDMVRKNLLATGSRVDADTGHADGPWGVTNGETQVRVIGLDILPGQHPQHYFSHGSEDRLLRGLALERGKQRMDVIDSLLQHRAERAAFRRAASLLWPRGQFQFPQVEQEFKEAANQTLVQLGIALPD